MKPWPETLLLLCSPHCSLMEQLILLMISTFLFLHYSEAMENSKVQDLKGKNSPHKTPFSSNSHILRFRLDQFNLTLSLSNYVSGDIYNHSEVART